MPLYCDAKAFPIPKMKLLAAGNIGTNISYIVLISVNPMEGVAGAHKVSANPY